MKYKDFYREILREGVKTNSFGSLPERPPYGFVVWPSGEFGVVENIEGHDDVAGGHGKMRDVIKSGGTRIAKIKYDDGEVIYQSEYLPTKTTQRAKKTSVDLAAHYQIELQWENARNWVTVDEGETNISEDYPVGWNKEEFEKINSFAGKLKYAREHLQIIASGSGRSVFRIDDQKALKIAKNKKGLAQNSVEAEKYLQQYDIVAKVFDVDNHYLQNIGPFWVEMELAKKISRKRFQELTKISIDDLEWYLREERDKQRKGARHFSSIPADKQQEWNNNEFIIDLLSMATDYDMSTGDMGRLSTYGEVLRDGQPKVVLIDYGLTNQVFDDYYKVGRYL